MRSRMISLPLGRPGLEPFERVGLMQQDVAPSARGHDGLRRPGVARDHEHAVPGLEPIAERLVPVGVRDQERGDGDVAVLIDDPGPRIRCIHLPTVGRMGLVPFGPDLDVPLVRLGQVLRHVPGTAGPEEAEWRLPLADPPGVDDIGEPDGVVAVQVGEEDDPDLLWKEPGNLILLRGRRRAPHHAGSGVNEVGGAVGHDRNRGAEALGVGVGSTGPEDNDH